jgi:hypothetical protein
VRTFGVTWSVGGYLVRNALRKLGTETAARWSARVRSELTTTFASHYAGRITLEQLFDPATLRRYAGMMTGEKFLIATWPGGTAVASAILRASTTLRQLRQPLDGT